MRLDPEHELSPASIELLQDVFGDSSPNAEVDEIELIHFACGTLDRDKEDELIQRLVQLPGARRRLVEILGAAEDFRSQPLHETRPSPLQTVTASSIFRSLTSPRAALVAAVQALTLASRTPAFASYRAPSESSLSGEIDAEGRLHVSRGNSKATNAEEPLAFGDVLIADPGGGTLFLDNPAIRSEFGSITGLGSGPLPGMFFRFATPADPIAHVFIESGHDILAAEVLESPQVKGEVLSFVLGPLPVQVTVEGLLAVSVSAGKAEQVLLTSPVGSWNLAPRTFQIPVPGVADTEVFTASLLHFRILGP